MGDSTSQANGHKPRNVDNLAPFNREVVPGYHEVLTAQRQPIGGLLPVDKYPENANPPKLFEPLEIRGVRFQNRAWVAPMCMYSSDDGAATDHHFVHLGSMAMRGWGNIMVEATGVTPEGRISPADSGLWKDSQIASFKRVVDFVHAYKGKIGIQLAHAGRKASCLPPFVQNKAKEEGWHGGVVSDYENEGWPEEVVAPSSLSFSKTYPVPKAASSADIKNLVQAFVDATERCKKIGFDYIEIHGAHGYLMHEFTDPLSNQRDDEYGGSFENRIRLPLEVTRAIRAVWDGPLFYRVSATDWMDDVLGPEKNANGEWQWWGVEQTTLLTAELVKAGIDLLDVSSGGLDERQKLKLGPSYQVPFCEHIKKRVPGILYSTVGLITEAHQANDILEQGKADAVMMARGVLNNIDFPLEAARELGCSVEAAIQFGRAWSQIAKPSEMAKLPHREGVVGVEGEEGQETKLKGV